MNNRALKCWFPVWHSLAPEFSERQRDRETERQRDRETERQRDRETERQRDREIESKHREIERHINKETK
jgi:hypothetical protein